VVNAVGYVLGLPGAGYRAMHDTPILIPTMRGHWTLAIICRRSWIKKSDIIEIGFRRHDPQWAKKFLGLLIGAYLDYHANISHRSCRAAVLRAAGQAVGSPARSG